MNRPSPIRPRPRPTMVRVVIHLALLVLASGALAAGEAKWLTRRVVIIVVDGPRWSETWGEPDRQYIPNQAKVMLPHGVLCTNFRNEGATLTNPGHVAICTGVYQPMKNDGGELPQHPGIHQAWLAASKAPATDAWLITSKDKLTILGDCQDAAWQGKFTPTMDCGRNGPKSGYRDDGITQRKLMTTFFGVKPHLVLVNFREPDSSGHANNWGGYLKGIRDTDGYLGEFWQALRADAELAKETTLFVTNDHGRHLDGVKDAFVSHGDDCEGCQHISLFAAGPDFKRGATSDARHHQIDIAVTVAELLGFTLPAAKGKVLWDLFENPPAGAK